VSLATTDLFKKSSISSASLVRNASPQVLVFSLN